MPRQEYQWVTMGEGFPPGLVTNVPDTSLEKNQAPTAFGLDTEAEGFIAKNTTVPASGTYAPKTVSLTNVGLSTSETYDWYYNRGWRLDHSTSTLIYSAPQYTTFYFPQNSGTHELFDTVGKLNDLVPVGQRGLACMGQKGTVIVKNADDPNGNWTVTPTNNSATISGVLRTIPIDGTVFFANTKGIFTLDDVGAVAEITRPLRNDAAFTTNSELRADLQQKRLVSKGASATYTFDVPTERWFKHVSTSFNYTTPGLRSDDGEPFTVATLAFEIERTDTSSATIDVQTKHDDQAWAPSSATAVISTNTVGETERVIYNLPIPSIGRVFQTRITNLDTNVKVRRITAQVANFTHGSYDTK